MGENIFIVQELLRKYIRKRISPRCTLKVDLHKAFDTIEWNFSRWMLATTRFPSSFVDWIMECVSTTSFSIIVNGNTYGHFMGKRGIKQGDPHSSYLFILGIEYLSLMMKTLESRADFSFHPSCHDIKLTHLAFADDMMFFCRGDTTSIRSLLQMLADF